MILAVCLNPALDVTYGVDALRPGASHRVRTVQRRPGGKGVNVARVLAQLGEPVRVLGLAGGPTGARLAAALDAAGVAHELVPVAGETRHTVTVVAGDGSDTEATVLNEPGPDVTPGEWADLLDAFGASAGQAAAVTLSGSLPRGLPDTAYATLVRRCGDVPVLLDTDGAPLAAALAARPTLAKPNADEAAGLLGRPVRTAADAAAACAALIDAGAGSAVVSRGAAGLTAVLGGRAYSAGLPAPVAGNPTGAGDALTAGLARGLAAGLAPHPLLAAATALAAAAVASGTAGSVAEGLADRLRPDVVITEH